jgi:hypothetical protein
MFSSFFGNAFESAANAKRFCEADHRLFAKAFVGKGGLYQAFRFGLRDLSLPSRRLNVGFVLEGDAAFGRYLAIYQSHLASEHPNTELLILARQRAFAAIWGGHNPALLTTLPDKVKFDPGELNPLVLPMGWHHREV